MTRIVPRNSCFSLVRAALPCAAPALAILLSTLTAQLATGADAATCTVLAIEGKLDVAAKGAAAWTAARTNQVLQAGDRVRTGSRSRATLRWSDLSVVRVNELTTLELAPPAKDGGKAQLDLKSGAAYFFSREKPS